MEGEPSGYAVDGVCSGFADRLNWELYWADWRLSADA